MSEKLTGQDALDALNREDNVGNDFEFTSFKSGSKFYVKVLGTADLMQFFSYGIFNKVNSFVPEKPSKKNKRGIPIEDLTPWDKAWKYHQEKSEEFGDAHSQEAYKYKPKQRFAMGFFDLDSGEPIVIDVSKNQGQAIYSAIKKYEKRLDRLAFELSKDGKGTNTTVSLTPVIDMEEDLTDKQRENFNNAPEEFDHSLFDGILYEIDEEEQVRLLVQAGFDVSLIGLDAPQEGEGEEEAKPIDANGDGTDETLPF